MYKIIFFGVYSKNGETAVLKFFGWVGVDPPQKKIPDPPGGPKLI